MEEARWGFNKRKNKVRAARVIDGKKKKEEGQRKKIKERMKKKKKEGEGKI
jgi:hypothetical protein